MNFQSLTRDRLCTAISAARTAAATTLDRAMGENPIGLSESAILARWLDSLSRNPMLLPHGWYLPPPHGYSILIGNPPEFERTNFSSLRAREKWADAEQILEHESLLTAYASPVERATGMIGDFMVTLYCGSDARVRHHIAQCLASTAAIADRVSVGMEFAELYAEAMDLIGAVGLRNDTRRTMERDGAPNIGHTVPWSDCRYNDRIWSAIDEGAETTVADLIGGARTFITGAERTRIGSNIAFTLEPKLASPEGPQVIFHVIVCIRGGVKHIHANFVPLFQRFQMTDYLPAETMRLLNSE